MTLPPFRDRLIGMGFIALAAIFFCIGALIFFDYLRNQSGISHYLPAQKTIAWLEVEDWRPELDWYLPAIKQKLGDYHDRRLGVILLTENQATTPVYYFRVKQVWRLVTHLGLNEKNEGTLVTNGHTFYLRLQRRTLFLAERQEILALLGPQTNSLSNDISYQRLHNNLPKQSWGKIYYRLDGLGQQILTALGYGGGDLVWQITTPLLTKMGAVGARLNITAQAMELVGIQNLPLERLPVAQKNGKLFVGYLAHFVPKQLPLLFVNGQDLASYYYYTRENLGLNLPASAELLSLWARGLKQRTAVDWWEDILAHFRDEYGLVVGLNPLAWEILLPLEQKEAAIWQKRILAALKNTLPTLHPVTREITLPDKTMARWQVADPRYDLVDYQTKHQETIIRGLRPHSQSQPSIVTAWYDGVLLVASDVNLLTASIAARQDKQSLSTLSRFPRDRSYVFANLNGLELTGNGWMPSLTNLLKQFPYLLAHQEILGFDVLLKATLSAAL